MRGASVGLCLWALPTAVSSNSHGTGQAEAEVKGGQGGGEGLDI